MRVNQFLVAICFAVASGVGQYLFKQLSNSLGANKLFSLGSGVSVLILVCLLIASQGVYLLALQSNSVTAIYPIAIGSSYLGVLIMSQIYLREPIGVNSIIGGIVVIAGLIIAKK